MRFSRRGMIGVPLIELLFWHMVLAIAAAVLVPNFIRARQQGQLTSCKSNLMNVAVALEMYGEDNQGVYPRELRAAAVYFKRMPTCPAAGADTYSAGYVSGTQDFTVLCRGQNHSALPADFPRLSNREGMYSEPQAAGGPSFFAFLVSVSSIPFWVLFAGQMFFWPPEPSEHGAAWLARHPRIAVLNKLAWFVLCLLCAAAGRLSAYAVWNDRLTLLVTPLVGALLARLLVWLGWRLWDSVSPPVPVERPEPQLDRTPALAGGTRSAVRLTPAEQFYALWVARGLPVVLMVLLIAVPWAGNDLEAALRLSLGIVAGIAVLSFPMFQWCKRWARELFFRELELLPGSGVVLEHSMRWGNPRVRRVGTQADMKDLTKVPDGLRFTLAGHTYTVADRSFAQG